MSELSAATLQSFYANQPTLMDQAVFLNSIDNLLEGYTTTDLGNAATQLVMDTISESIKTLIVNSNMPEAVKDRALARVDEVMAELGEQCPCTPEALADLQNSEMHQELMDIAQAANEVLDDACCPEGSSVINTEAALETISEAANETSLFDGPAEISTVDDDNVVSEAVTIDEATTEAISEASNEATAPLEIPDGISGVKEAADSAMDSLLAETGESQSTSRSGGKSFLEILAQSMGEAQAKMLNQALEYSNQMKEMAGDETKADDFTIAQAQYTALMQMFNIYSNQVATTLKTLGEAMAGIARKQ